MSILLTLIGATIGAVIGSLFMHWRSDVAKERQQLESKTPYDYALTNARADNERYREELRTIKALKRTEADTERIRTEIGTILSDDGEEAAEGVYGGLNGIPIVQHSDGTISPFPSWDGMNTEEATRDAGSVARAYGGNVREDDTKDERMADKYEECSLTKVVRDSFENREMIRVTWRDSSGSLRFRRGVADEIATVDGKVKEFGMWGLEIFAGDVEWIAKGGRNINGETLYRKGNTHIDEESEWDYM